MSVPERQQPGRIYRDFGPAIRELFGIVGGGTSPTFLRTDLGVQLVVDIHRFGEFPVPARTAWGTTEANTIDTEAHLHELRNPPGSRTLISVDRVILTARDTSGTVEWRALRESNALGGTTAAYRDRSGIPVGRLLASTPASGLSSPPELVVLNPDGESVDAVDLGARLDPGSKIVIGSIATLPSNARTLVSWFWREATL